MDITKSYNKLIRQTAPPGLPLASALVPGGKSKLHSGLLCSPLFTSFARASPCARLTRFTPCPVGFNRFFS